MVSESGPVFLASHEQMPSPQKEPAIIKCMIRHEREVNKIMTHVFYTSFNIIHIKHNNKLEEISNLFVQFQRMV